MPSHTQMFMRRNSVYVAFILVGALVGERVRGRLVLVDETCTNAHCRW